MSYIIRGDNGPYRLGRGFNQIVKGLLVGPNPGKARLDREVRVGGLGLGITQL